MRFGELLNSILALAVISSPSLGADFVVKNGNKESAKPNETISVNSNDLRILERAEKILKDSSKWNRHDNRECPPSAITFSLYCALWKASVEINGEFDHRLGALEELRRTVEDFSRGKHYEHRLMDYNNDPSTKLSDIQNVLYVTKQRINRRLVRKAK